MQMGQTIHNSVRIYKSELNGKAVYKFDSEGSGDVSSSKNPVLVRQDAETGGWKPVEKLDKNIGNADLRTQYGMWTDKRRISDFFRKDGIPQADEVESFNQGFDEETYRGYEPFEIGDWMISGRRYFYSSVRSAEIDVQGTSTGNRISLELNSVIDKHEEENGYFHHS